MQRGPKMDNDNTLICLDELVSSENLCQLGKENPSKTKATQHTYLSFESELVEYVYNMVDYWNQFGFLGKATKFEVVSTITDLSLKCITQIAIPLDEDDDETKDLWDLEEDGC
jgi:hypothetical protein